MVSTEVTPDVRWTDDTPLPTRTATQLAGAPSAVPKDPAPRSSTVSAAGDTDVGKGTEPLPTARSVDSSTTICPHVAAGWAGSVPVDPDPEPVDEVDGVTGVPTKVRTTPLRPPTHCPPRRRQLALRGKRRLRARGTGRADRRRGRDAHGRAGRGVSASPGRAAIGSVGTDGHTRRGRTGEEQGVRSLDGNGREARCPGRAGSQSRAGPAGGGRRRRRGNGLGGGPSADQLGSGQDTGGGQDHRDSHRAHR